MRNQTSEPLTLDTSDTPKTDAVAFWITNERARREAVFADFARGLERELAKLRADVEEICQQRTTAPINRARLRHALAGVDWRKVKP